MIRHSTKAPLRRALWIGLTLLVSSNAIAFSGSGQKSAQHPGASKSKGTEQRVLKRLASQPTRFEANKGQFDPEVKFAAKLPAYSVALTPRGALYALRSPRTGEPASKEIGSSMAKNQSQELVMMSLIGGSSNPKIVGAKQLGGFTNYFIGQDQSQWRTGVPHFGRVVYRSAYPGIDLVYRSAGDGGLEYDFVVSPKGETRDIAMHFETSGKVKLSAHGDLVIPTKEGTLRQKRPKIYQTVKGARRSVPGGFLISPGNQVRFWTGAYDTSRRLVVDPEIEYSGFLGDAGNGNDDRAFSVAVDGDDAAFVTGFTSGDFKTITADKAAQPLATAATMAFLTKLSPQGEVVYSTYLAGISRNPFTNQGHGISLDTAGNAFITGRATTDFPTTPSAFRPICAVDDAFVAQINPNLPGPASLVFSTCLIGQRPPVERTQNGQLTLASPAAVGESIDVIDSSDPQTRGIYLSGVVSASVRTSACTLPPAQDHENSLGFCSSKVYENHYRGGESDYFVARMNLQGRGVDYFTFLGGNFDDGTGVIGGGGYAPVSSAVDALETGEAYVTGRTAAAGGPAGYPLAPPPPTAPNGSRAVVTRLDTRKDLGSLVWSTTLGGSPSAGFGVAVDSATRSVYVTGITQTPNLDPQTGGPTQLSGPSDAFVARFDVLGTQPPPTPIYPAHPNYFAYVGGSGTDSAQGIALGPSLPGNNSSQIIFISGSTYSSDFHSPDGISAPSFPDAFVTKVDTSRPSNQGRLYSIRLASPREDASEDVAVNEEGDIFVVGLTHGPGFPVKPMSTPGNPSEGFITKLTATLPEVRIDPKAGPEAGGTTVDITGSALAGAYKVHFGGQEIPFQTIEPGQRLRVQSPPFAGERSVNVRVTTPEGTSPATVYNLFTYVPNVSANGPILTSVIPATGDKAGGTTVSITGSRFTGATQVRFGPATIAAPGFTVLSDTEIKLSTPGHDRAETVLVTVTTPEGTSNPGQFTYTEAAAIPPEPPKQEAGLTANPVASQTKALTVVPPGGGGITSPNLAPISVTAPAPGANPGQAPNPGPMPGTVPGTVPGSATIAGRGGELAPGAGLVGVPDDVPEPATRHAMVGASREDESRLRSIVLAGLFCMITVGGVAAAGTPSRREDEPFHAAPQAAY